MQSARAVRESRPSVRVLTRRKLVGLILLLSVAAAACNDSDPKVTAEVESVSSAKVCIRPEDMKTWDHLRGCYPPAESGPGLSAGDCIEARVPTPVDSTNDGKPLREVTKLQRSCR